MRWGRVGIGAVWIAFGGFLLIRISPDPSSSPQLVVGRPLLAYEHCCIPGRQSPRSCRSVLSEVGFRVQARRERTR
ncbi:hypothetical protein GGU10DRAFT_350426 [Lentinula aff. detonsa]|uniref:Uncharacterized protein n=1 Tax=Lentinula aff. detonsa TaxID=2804958 RepID=A0AA38L693_9AGAR|nr:hypothetical protein GGU10DRAFT_350426 [Lentinula aff. detonsa]